MTVSTDIPFYKNRPLGNKSDYLTKSELAVNFPDAWVTPDTKKDLNEGKAEIVTTTGTSHDRMRLIRPPFFLLTQYFDAMEEIVSDTHGTIIEYVGDAILAVWNAPEEIDNHAEESIRCALQMQLKLAESVRLVQEVCLYFKKKEMRY